MRADRPALGHLRRDLDPGAALALDDPRIAIGVDQRRAALFAQSLRRSRRGPRRRARS